MPSSGLPFLPDFAMTRCPRSARRYANTTPGGGKLQVPMTRYVILAHDHPFLHWDLMLEHDGSLRTWRLATPPVADQDVAAEELADHRLAYLDYEGPVSGN